MKVLIYGGKGWIGTQFVDLLKLNNIEYVIGNARADDRVTVSVEVLENNPTHIVSFIGRTHGEGVNTIDYLEKPGKLTENIRDNLYAPLNLASVAIEYKKHYTYLGTGCIFSAEDPTKSNYNEQDTPDFFGSSYSIVKGYTDRIMHHSVYKDKVLNLRIRMPIVPYHHPRNFITKISKYEKVCSIPNSMTVLPDLLPKVIDMMERQMTGTVNLVNPGLISHNEILEMYKEIVDPNFTWKNFTIEEQDQVLASKRSNNKLDTSKLESFYPDIPNIKVSVRNCLENFNFT